MEKKMKRIKERERGCKKISESIYEQLYRNIVELPWIEFVTDSEKKGHYKTPLSDLFY